MKMVGQRGQCIRDRPTPSPEGLKWCRTLNEANDSPEGLVWCRTLNEAKTWWFRTLEEATRWFRTVQVAKEEKSQLAEANPHAPPPGVARRRWADSIGYHQGGKKQTAHPCDQPPPQAEEQGVAGPPKNRRRPPPPDALAASEGGQPREEPISPGLCPAEQVP